MVEPTQRLWYYALGGKKVGPCSLAELAGLLRDGRLPPDTLVWTPGRVAWAPAGEVEEVREALAVTAWADRTTSSRPAAPPAATSSPPAAKPAAATSPAQATRPAAPSSPPAAARPTPAPAADAATSSSRSGGSLFTVVLLSAVVLILAVGMLRERARSRPPAQPVTSSPAAAPTGPAAERIPQLVQAVQPSVVTIRTFDATGDTLGQGSGFFAGSAGEIVTNWHVLRGAAGAEAILSDGSVFPIAGVRAIDSAADLVRAVVATSRPTPALELAATDPPVGSAVLVVGSPLGLDQTVSTGIVSAVRRDVRFGTLYQIDAPISHGSSGSPVVGADGKVIGVATMMLGGGQNLNFAVAATGLAQLPSGELRPLASLAPPRGSIAAGDAAEGVADMQVMAGLQRGEEIFRGRGNCASCHGLLTTGTASGPDLSDPAWLDCDGSAPAIAAIIRAGVPAPVRYPNPMPPMGGATLTRADVAFLTAYVYAMSH